MNVIDQAFVKAFARRTRSQSAAPTVAAAAEPHRPPPADLTVHPQAAESAVMWYDTDAEDYLRREQGHRPTGPIGDTHGLQEPRARRLPADQPAPVDTPAVAAASPQVAPAEPANFDLSELLHSQVAFAAPPELLLAEPTPAPKPDAPLGAAPLAVAPLAPALPVASAPEPFSPAWEVDRFEFSHTITALFSDPTLVQSIGHPLDRAVNEGLQTLLITGDRTGVGQTSVATGIAISAAAAGLRVALVDATTAAGGTCSRALADALNLEVQQGWPEALRAGQSAAQAAVYSIEDQLTVIPKATPHCAAEPTMEEFRRLIAPLRQAFDLVVIDGPCCREPTFKYFTAIDQPVAMPDAAPSVGSPDQPPVDAVILVQDVRHADQVLAAQVMRSLRFHGITGLGLVENFT